MKHGILWLMIFSFQLNATAQNLKTTIEFADRQFDLKNYQLAVKEYQRVLFFAKGEYLDYLYSQIAHSFFANKQFEQANYFYELSYKTATLDSVKNERILNKVQCYLLSGSYKKAVYELMNLPDSLSIYFRKKQDFYYAVSYFGLEEFKQSEKYFLSLLNDNEQARKDEITRLFRKKRNLYKPNPKTAKILSIFLPGSGQMYAGDVKNSFNSLLLTGGFAGLGVFMAKEYTVLDAILTTFPWFMRYHKGGYVKAKKIAQEKRAIRRNKTYKKVLKIIENSNSVN